MGFVEPRTLTAFAAGGLVAAVSGTLGAAFAAHPSEHAAGAARAAAASAPGLAARATTTPLITKACANKKTGVVTVVGAGTQHTKCARTEKSVRFAGSLLSSDGSLRVTSPNKLYQIVVSNNGVGLRGPGGALTIDSFALKTFDSAGRAK
jgi:hypothetical protein